MVKEMSRVMWRNCHIVMLLNNLMSLSTETGIYSRRELAWLVCVNEKCGVVAVHISPSALICGTLVGKLLFHIQFFLRTSNVCIPNIDIGSTGDETKYECDK